MSAPVELPGVDDDMSEDEDLVEDVPPPFPPGPGQPAHLPWPPGGMGGWGGGMGQHQGK